MAKAKKTIFFCQQCGYETAKWMGQCPGCREWNTFVEEPAEEKHAGISTGNRRNTQSVEPMPLSRVEMTDQERFTTGIGELDRVLGGGIVPASLVLVGGDPGIGKSTLLLQVCKNLADAHHSVLYISGEESLQQIKIRADRIGSFTESLELFCETNLADISSVLRRRNHGWLSLIPSRPCTVRKSVLRREAFPRCVRRHLCCFSWQNLSALRFLSSDM